MLTAITSPATPALAFLEGIGAMEMMLVAVVGLLLFGGKGLPDMARTLGRVVREFKKASASVEHEVKRVMDEEPETKPHPRRPAPKPHRQSLTDNTSALATPIAAPPSTPPAPTTPPPPTPSAPLSTARDLPPPPPADPAA